MIETDALHLLLHVSLGLRVPEDKRSFVFYRALSVLHTCGLVEGCTTGGSWPTLSDRGKKYMEMITATPMPIPVFQKTIWIDPREVK